MSADAVALLSSMVTVIVTDALEAGEVIERPPNPVTRLLEVGAGHVPDPAG